MTNHVYDWKKLLSDDCVLDLKHEDFSIKNNFYSLNKKVHYMLRTWIDTQYILVECYHLYAVRSARIMKMEIGKPIFASNIFKNPPDQKLSLFTNIIIC